MATFTEVADRVWVARYDWFDANITLIGSERGLIVVDTHGSAAMGREVLGDIRALGPSRVHAVVNTHWHFDHTFGNVAFREVDPEVPIHAHAEAARNLAEWGPARAERFRRDGGPRAQEVLETELVIPDHTFSTFHVLDLGDREVELIHPGRGHTGGDLVVRVPDAGVLAAGDLVEESGPPAYGSDSWPLEWGETLTMVLALTTPTMTVVPGHGAPVDQDFVRRQHASIDWVATTVRDLARSGVPVEEALDAVRWPWHKEHLQHAVERGYAQLDER
ncbi:MAG: MBL fold metallo-hydrolase [Actinomycetia bacterium]|nr:MBL fold metallo-hydrolase [Actinomycetes bacterium]